MEPSEPLESVFDTGTRNMMNLLVAEEVSQINVNRHDQVWYVGSQGKVKVSEKWFNDPKQYRLFLNHLLSLTDAGYNDINKVRLPIVEASLRAPYRGSIHVCMPVVSRDQPVLIIRKQPISTISLDRMLEQGIMNPQMRDFLETAMRGRLNLLISGGSGAGKTTLARALAGFIDPDHRVITAEDIDELNLQDRLPDVVALTTYTARDTDGRVLYDMDLAGLVRETLRMRPDRVIVGEVRGKEAYALTKAMNSGHDGSFTTIHADDSGAAVKAAVTYVMEGGVAEEVARDQVSRAFNLVIQIAKIRPGERRITEITELEPVREGGTEQRRIELFKYDYDSDSWVSRESPSPRLKRALARGGANGV